MLGVNARVMRYTFPFVVTLFTLFVNYWRDNVSLLVVKMLIVNELSV